MVIFHSYVSLPEGIYSMLSHDIFAKRGLNLDGFPSPRFWPAC